MPPVVLDVTLNIDRGQINALQKALAGAVSAGVKGGSIDLSSALKTDKLAQQISKAFAQGVKDGMSVVPASFLKTIQRGIRDSAKTGLADAFKAGIGKGVDFSPLTASIQKAVAAGIKAAVKSAGPIKVTASGTSARASAKGAGAAATGVSPSVARAAANSGARSAAAQARAQAALAAAQTRAQAVAAQAAARAAATQATSNARVNAINAQAAARAAAVQQNAQGRIAANQAAAQARMAARANQPPSLATQSWRASQAIQFGGGIVSSLGAPRVGAAIGNVGNIVEALGPTIGVAASAIVGFAVTAVQAFADIARAGLQSQAEMETAYSRLAALTGLNANEVGGVGRTIEGISSGPTVSTTQELADAVYNIASTGFSGGRSSQILTASNTASLAGLGDIGSTSALIGKVLTTYGEKNISAARATDILTAAVRDGAAEGSDFTNQIGKLLPFAQELGIGFDEVAASLSSVSVITRDSAVASTQLQNAYSKLLSPTGEGLSVLDQLYGEGRGAQGVQEQIRTEGFLKTLRSIYTAAEGNKQVLGDLFGDIRGLSGVLTLANDDFSRFETTLGNVRNSFGQTQDAANEFTEDTATRLVVLGNEFDRFARMVAQPFASPFNALLSDMAVFMQMAQSGTSGRLPGQIGAGLADWAGNAIGVYDPNNVQLTDQQISTFGGSAGIESNRAALEGRGTNVDEMLRQARAMELRQSVQISQADYAAQRRKDAASQYERDLAAKQPMQDGKKVFPAQSVGLIEDLAQQGADLKEGAIEKRAEANRQFASQLGQALDTAIENTSTYDQQFEKLDKAEAKLAKTPASVSYGGLSARESKRLKTLQTSLEIGRISNNIRERNIQTAQANLGAAQKQLAIQNGTRRVDNAIDRDTIGDIRFKNLEEEYSGLQGRAARGSRAGVNPAYQASLDERDTAMREYNVGGYNLIQDKFIQVLGAASKDGKTFNNILNSGGDILQAFAKSAGLFETSGFTMQLAEAGLEAKYLRDSLTGGFLQGDELEQGFANYSVAIQKFRDEFADARKFMEGTEPIKMQTLIDFQIMDEATVNIATNVKEQKRMMDDAQKTYAQTGDVRVLERAEVRISEARFDLKDASTAEGFRRNLLEKYGLNQEFNIKSMVRFESLFSQENKNKLESEAKAMEETLKGVVARINEQLRNLGNFTVTDLKDNPSFKNAFPNLQTLFGPGLDGAWNPNAGKGGEKGAKEITVTANAKLDVNLVTSFAKLSIDNGIIKLKEEIDKNVYKPEPTFNLSADKTNTGPAKLQMESSIKALTESVSGQQYIVPVNITYSISESFSGGGGVPLPAGAYPAGNRPPSSFSGINAGNTVPAPGQTSSGTKNGTVVTNPDGTRRRWVIDHWEEYASGTAQMRDGWALVGERGPEIIYNNTPNTGVLNAAETRATLAGRDQWYSQQESGSFANAAASPLPAPIYDNAAAGMDQWERQNPAPRAPFDLSSLPAAPSFGLSHEDYMNMSNYNSMINAMMPMSSASKASLNEYMFRGTDSNGNRPVKTSLGNVKGQKSPINYWQQALEKQYNLSMPMDTYGWRGYNPGAKFYDRFDSRQAGGKYSISNSNTTLNVDARGSTQELRVQEAVERAVSKAMRQYSSYEGNARRGMRARGAR